MIQSHIVFCVSVFRLVHIFGMGVAGADGAEEAVLITGGTSTEHSAQVFLPATGWSCRLPDLPDDRWLHTQDGGLACGGYGGQNQGTSCLRWSPDSGTWTLSHNLTEERDNHVSWTPDPSLGTYLLGGSHNSRTTELVKPEGSVEQGFYLKHTE